MPEPDPQAAPTGLDRHVGRYERKGVAFEVTVTFATLPDGRAQLSSSGRVAPRVT